MRASDAELRAAEGHERELEAQYQALIGEITSDVAQWLAGAVDSSQAKEIDGGRWISETHVAELIARFVEVQST